MGCVLAQAVSILAQNKILKNDWAYIIVTVNNCAVVLSTVL